MSTPLSLSLPETASLSVVSSSTSSTDSAGASATTEQVTYWTVLGVVSAALAAGVLEVALHLAG